MKVYGYEYKDEKYNIITQSHDYLAVRVEWDADKNRNVSIVVNRKTGHGFELRLGTNRKEFGNFDMALEAALEYLYDLRFQSERKQLADFAESQVPPSVQAWRSKIR